MVSKLVECTDLKNKYICVLNLEFIEVMCYDFGVERKNIWFVTDCKEKKEIAKEHSKFKGVNVHIEDIYYGEPDKWSIDMEFDIKLRNPPYQKQTEGGNGKRDLWPDFVEESFSRLKEGGFCVNIHPPTWRKPEHKIYDVLSSKQMEFLKMLGDSAFPGISTKADYYILKNEKKSHSTTIIDETGKQIELDLGEVNFIPNSLIEEIKKLLAEKNGKKCEVIYSSSIYDNRKPYVSWDKKGKFKFPCVNSINSDDNGGLICLYANTNKNGHFGIPKVILTLGRYLRPLNDFDGKYGMTNNAFGIEISSRKEGDLISAAINTSKFKEIVKATKWNNFQTDWRFFKYLKKDFWKHFVDENGKELE
jgi:hypothetical protein